VTGAAAAGTLAAEVVGTPAVNVAIFAFFIAVTLVIAVSVAGTNRTTTDYYAGGCSASFRAAGHSRRPSGVAAGFPADARLVEPVPGMVIQMTALFRIRVRSAL
jgi:hypothetical protein